MKKLKLKIVQTLKVVLHMLHWYGRLFEWTEEMCRFHESRFNSLSQIKHFTRPSPIGMHFDWSSPILVSDRSEAGDVYESNASDREDSPYGLFRSSVFISTEIIYLIFLN